MGDRSARSHILTLTLTQARRLAITRQRLAGPRPSANARGIMDIVRDLGCLQIDPISAVARSPLLVLWSRLGVYDTAHLDQLLWRERRLFEYWAHCASIVPTDDYPIHHAMMRSYVADDSPWSRRVRKWIKDNDPLRRTILTRLRRDGPLPARELAEDGIAPRAWVSTGWTSERNVSRMLDFLWMQGKIMVAGREGLQKIWDLSERCLPAWTPREKMSERQIVRHAVQRSLRALGVATARQISQYFIRGRYPDLSRVLVELETERVVERVQIIDDGATLPGEWYIHTDDTSQLNRLAHAWQPRTTLLSPFDNLICDRTRTRRLFDFDYAMEIYVPASKRKYGYYVLPILHGDRLIGRIDPVMDRQNARLTINAVYAEQGAPKSAARAISTAIQNLAEFLGARQIVYTRRVPAMWKPSLTSFR